MRRAAVLLLAAMVTAIIAPRPGQAVAPSNDGDYSHVTFAPVIVDPALVTPPPTMPPRPEPAPHVIVVLRPAPPVSREPTVAEAQAWALAQLAVTQYACLVSIVKHEDGTWNPTRTAPDGAYGIPQALPGSKMATAGADWRTNRITQLRWMIAYVDRRYGSPCAAAAFRDAHGWY